MKKLNCLRFALVASLMLLPCLSKGELDVTNRLTFSARFGLNISAKFKQPRTSAGAPGNPRFTPEGDAYNYDDGYALPDSSGSEDGQTWYWGYDNSSSQISGNSILLSRSTSIGNSSSPSFDSDPNYGAEMTYNRQIGVAGKVRYGFEVAVNYLNIGLSDSGSFARRVNRVTDAYPFTPGTVPPEATPSDPYQGSFAGPGFTIGTDFTSSTSVVVDGTITDRRRLDADLWGWRLGPYFEIPFGERLLLSMSGGLAVGLLSSSASWTETAFLSGGLRATTSGRGHDHDLVLGAYVGANAAWRLSQHWNAVGGVQYQNVGTSRQTAGGRRVELDLSNSVFVTLGLGCSF